MNKLLLTLAAVLATWGLTETAVHASHCPWTPMVNEWYGRYLGRPVDPIGLNEHVRALHRGAEPVFVEASLLGSDEYFLKHGGMPQGFIDGMFHDVLGRCAQPAEMRFWVEEYRGLGCRHRLAYRFLRDTRPAVVVEHAPVIHQPAPVIVRSAPVVVRPAPVIVRPAPVVVHHHHRPHGHGLGCGTSRPIVVDPRPTFSINLRFGR